MNTYQLYGNIFTKLFNYSKKHPLHSETFHYNIIKQHKTKNKKKINIKLINFRFRRVRANGNIIKNYKNKTSLVIIIFASSLLIAFI